MTKTWDEWRKLGYFILKGSKASWENSIPKFNESQVTTNPSFGVQRSTYGVVPGGDLMHQIKLQTHQFGLGFGGLEQTCEWIVDNPDEEEDHWMDVREY